MDQKEEHDMSVRTTVSFDEDILKLKALETYKSASSPINELVVIGG